MNKIEPNHHQKPDTLIRAKYSALAESFSDGICAVTDLVTTANGQPSRKPQASLSPHQIASHSVEKLRSTNPNILICEHATIAFGDSTQPKQRPTIGISTLQARLPTKIVANKNFIQDMHEASGLGIKVTQIPDAFELATAVAMILNMKKYKVSSYLEFIVPPSHYHKYIEDNPRYLAQRIALFDQLNRLQPIHKILPLQALVMIFDSALNAPGPMIQTTWDKFIKKI